MTAIKIVISIFDKSVVCWITDLMVYWGAILNNIMPFYGLPWYSADKESISNSGDPGLIPGWGRSSGGGHDNPHGQRSLAGYSPWGYRVRQDWVTKHKTTHAFVGGRYLV